MKAKQNNYYTASKMMKLQKFGLTIPIFESQTEQLLNDFEDFGEVVFVGNVDEDQAKFLTRSTNIKA